jgi:hypothetical protein
MCIFVAVPMTNEMEGLNSHQRQKLIDLKNRLLEESDRDYDHASIEENRVKEHRLLKSSSVKEKIAKEIEAIIYDATK